MAAVSKTVKKTLGKENAPPARVRDEFDDMNSDDGLPAGGASRAKSSGKTTNGNSDNKKVAELERRLADRDRYRSQRDDFSKQFEELSKLRQTEAEGQFEKLKEKTAVYAQAQNDIIANQTKAIEKQEKKVLDLEARLKKASELPTAGGPFEAAAKADPKEIKKLKDELAKAHLTIVDQGKKLTTAEKELKAETEFSRKLQASKGSGAGTSVEDSAKDAACLRLYEEMMDLGIVGVKIKEDAKAGKEVIFNCISTYNAKSLNFKLKTYNTIDPAKKTEPGGNPWVKMVQYYPENLDKESADFVESLGHFAQEFKFPRPQLSEMMDSLRGVLEG